MTISRLAVASPVLARDLENQPPSVQRTAAMLAARYACERAALADADVEALLASTAIGVVDETARTTVRLFAESLDESAWAIQDRVESGAAAYGDYLAEFSRARAAWAAYYASLEDPKEASAEAIYEASVAVDDASELEMVVRRSFSAEV